MDGSPEELTQLVGPVVVEQFDERTSLHFFGSRQEALGFAAALPNEFTIRQAKLEDVFVKLTEERVSA